MSTTTTSEKTPILTELRQEVILEEIDRYGHFLMTIDFLSDLLGENHPLIVKMKSRDTEAWREWFIKNNLLIDKVKFRDKKLRRYFNQLEE